VRRLDRPFGEEQGEMPVNQMFSFRPSSDDGNLLLESIPWPCYWGSVSRTASAPIETFGVLGPALEAGLTMKREDSLRAQYDRLQ
jgi:hypothetical protein